MVAPWLRLLLAGSILVPTTVLGVNAFQSHITAKRHADIQITSTVRMVREQATKVLETNALTLTLVDRLVADMSWEEISNSTMVHDELRRLNANLPHVSSIVLVKPNGIVANASRELPSVPIELTDREHYISLRDTNTELYITPMYRGRVSHEMQFSIAKRRTSKDSEFDGMIVVSDRSSYFFRTFDEAALPDTCIALALTNGKILASWPERNGGEIPSAMVQQVPANDILLLSATSVVHQVPGRIGIERVPNYPLVVAFSIADSRIYASWRYDTILAAVISGFGIGCVVTAGLVALRAYRHLRETYVRLTHEMNRRQVAETKLRHTQRMEALGQLTAGVAHDFNNMLTVIVGNVEQIILMTTNTYIQQKVDRVLVAATRGATLAAQMLTFSRRQILHTERCDINEEIANITPLIESSVGQTIKLNIIPHCTPLFCTLDRSELTLALMNIVNNAAQAMPQYGTLTIAMSLVENYSDLSPGQYTRIIMEDTGEGMSDEICQRAFEPFFTTRDLTIGTGLGLSQVYGFAKQCGGDVTIESKSTEGTKVTLYLPMSDTKPAKIVTILVVDDATDILDVLGPSLESCGYIVLCTNDPQEALQLVDNHTIALMLTDMVMPDMSGVELADRVIAKHPTIKVLLMTGYSNQVAAHPILRKPFRLQELVDRVKQTLGESSPGRWT